MTVLYNRNDVSSLQVGADVYVPDKQGRFDLPDDVAESIHRVHVNGEKVWETHPEREARLEAERLAKRRDPAALLDAVEQLAAASPAPTQSAAELRVLLEAAEKAEAEAKKPARKTTTKK